jgi:Zn-dependent protease
VGPCGRGGVVLSAYRPNYAYSYTIGAPPAETRRVTTSPTEILHILVAFLVLTFDLTIIWVRFSPFAPGVFSLANLLAIVGLGATAALTGFVLHEMAHKVSAERRGFWAEFRMSPMGLVLSMVVAFFGFLIAAPGATMIGGMGDVRSWGRTSLAGPATNLAEGAIFLAVGFALLSTRWIFLVPYVLFLALINAFFAAFNLLPIGPLDGRKVFRWSVGVWGSAFAVSVLFAGYVYLVIFAGLPF